MTPGRIPRRTFSNEVGEMPSADRLVNIGIPARDAKAICSGICGEVKFGFWNTAPEGWLLLDGSTIGNSASGANHADNLCRELFIQLWNVTTEAYCPTGPVPGRGASAIADWAANRYITLPDATGRAPLSIASAGTGSSMGAVGGSLSHTHTIRQHYHAMGNGGTLSVPLNHDHGSFNSADENAHVHAMPFNCNLDAVVGYFGASGTAFVALQGSSPANSGTATHRHSVDPPAFTGSATPTGSIGYVNTGGLNGDADQNSGGNSYAQSYFVVRAIIAL